MKKLFIGIDISKDVFDFVGLDLDGAIVLPAGVVSNDVDGINGFVQKLLKIDDVEVRLCMEHTGYYGTLLATELSNNDLCFSLINPLEIKKSMGMARGKNDAVDAFRIANYALTHRHLLRPHRLSTEKVQKLKALMGMRDSYVKILVQLKNSFKAYGILSKSISLKPELRQHQKLIKGQEKAIANTERQMLAIINEEEQLKTVYSQITTVIGVGPITAIKCMVETENFTKFNSGRKFACHCGVAPFKYESGSSIRGRTRTSPLSNKDLKGILFKAASTAIQHDPQLKNYYKRKTGKGKHKLAVLNAVANKIILRIFTVVKRDEPYLKLSA